MTLQLINVLHYIYIRFLFTKLYSFKFCKPFDIWKKEHGSKQDLKLYNIVINNTNKLINYTDSAHVYK